MFYILYREKSNNKILQNLEKGNNQESKNDENNENNEINKNRDCILCLENNNELFYNYKFRNNKYNHNCECTPNIHYKCFKDYYKKKHNCIICLKNIEKKDDFFQNCYILMKISKLKFSIIIFILCLGLYNLIEDIDFIYLYNLDKKDLLMDDIH